MLLPVPPRFHSLWTRILPSFLLLTISATALQAQEARWYKGNVHTHSLWSDGDDFPEMIMDWYKSHGYDFISLSDHNILAAGEKAITTTNRNFVGRMGSPKSEVYLSNPAVAAASAVLGRIGTPEELK